MKKGTVCLYISIINSSKRHHLELVWLALTQFLGLRALELFLSPVSVVVTGWSCGNHLEKATIPPHKWPMAGSWLLDLLMFNQCLQEWRLCGALQHWMWSSTTLQPSVGSPDKKSNKEMAADNVKFVKLHATNEVCLERTGRTSLDFIIGNFQWQHQDQIQSLPCLCMSDGSADQHLLEAQWL